MADALTSPWAGGARGTAPPPVVVIGVGNALRGDDAAGLEVARRVRSLAYTHATEMPAGIVVLEQERETLSLIEQWEGAAAVVLVDALRSGAHPGAIRRIDASSEPLPAELRSSASTHAVGVAEAIELARTLGRLPARVVFYGIEGARFDAGRGLTHDVHAVIPTLADAVVEEARRLASAEPG